MKIAWNTHNIYFYFFFHLGYHSDAQANDQNLSNYRRNNCGVSVAFFDSQSTGTANRYSIHQNGKNNVFVFCEIS